ncbi:MAG: DUF58 domain-containing protein [Streptosporangiales bacterium]
MLRPTFEALGSLTLRGRGLLGAGIAAIACGVLLGEDVLLRIGLLVAVLPLVAAVVVARTGYRLNSNRQLEAHRVSAGHAVSITLRLDNVSRLPTGLLLIEDAVPYQLGSAPRFVLDRVEPRGVREVRYTLRSDVRGRYQIGPLSVRLTDPFGLVELNRAFHRTDKLVVTPAVQPLPTVALTGAWTGGGDSHARTVAAAGEDDVATREYRRGDDLRRVHWKTTAKRGELMVRREEQHWQSRCALFLDTRHRAYHGEGPGSAFEYAVSATASIGINLVHGGFGLRMVTDAGLTLSGYGGLSGMSGGALEGMLLEHLAMVRASRRPGLAAGIADLRASGSTEGLIVAVIGTLEDADADELARLRQGRSTGVAVLVDSASWSSTRSRLRESERYEQVASQLRSAGWRVVPVGYGRSLAKAWPNAGRSRAAAPRPAAAASDRDAAS